MPLGPKVLFTKSPIAMAPIKEDWNKKNQRLLKSILVLKLKKYNSIFKRIGRTRLTRRAVSALSSSAPALKMLTGARERDA